MPGFTVNGIGSGPPAPPTPFFKYTWEIDTLFGEGVHDGSVLIYAREASLPTWDVELVEVMGASLKYKFAGHMNFGDIKIVWYDTDGLADQISSWRDMVWTPDGGIQTADSYKNQSAITSLSFDGSSSVSWKLVNSWPKAVHVGELSYVDSDMKLADATLVYDWAEKS